MMGRTSRVGKKLVRMMSRASRKGRIGGKRELDFRKRKGG